MKRTSIYNAVPLISMGPTIESTTNACPRHLHGDARRSTRPCCRGSSPPSLLSSKAYSIVLDCPSQNPDRKDTATRYGYAGRPEPKHRGIFYMATSANPHRALLLYHAIRNGTKRVTPGRAKSLLKLHAVRVLVRGIHLTDGNRIDLTESTKIGSLRTWFLRVSVLVPWG